MNPFLNPAIFRSIHFRMFFGDLVVHFGSLWISSGSCLVSPWHPLGSLLAPLGSLLDPFGSVLAWFWLFGSARFPSGAIWLYFGSRSLLIRPSPSFLLTSLVNKQGHAPLLIFQPFLLNFLQQMVLSRLI